LSSKVTGWLGYACAGGLWQNVPWTAGIKGDVL